MKKKTVHLITMLLLLGAIGLPPSLAGADEGDTFDPPDGAARTEFTSYADGWSTAIFDAVGNLIDYVEQRDVPVETGTYSTDQQCSQPEGTFGYLFNPARRWGGTSTYRFNANVTAAWRTAINAGQNEWENTTDACGVPDIIGFAANQGTDTTAFYNCGGADGTNAVSLANLGTNGVLGRACVYTSTTAGRIAESDVQFNTAYPWATNGAYNAYDIQSVAAHEFGHYLGMGHSAGTCNSNYNWTVMYPCTAMGDTTNRTLSIGDIEGAAQLYGYTGALYSGTVTNLDFNKPISNQKLAAGFEVTANFDVRNDGPLPWRVGGGRVKLGTSNPHDRTSVFKGADWVSNTRASYVDTNLSNAAKPFVSPGETGRFSFTFRVPFSKRGTVTNEYFQPVAEGENWFAAQNGYALDVGSYAAAVVDKATLPPILVRGLSYPVYVVLQNNGTAPWFLNDGMKLGTSSPRNRTSSFQSSDWLSTTRASAIDQNDTLITKTYIAPGEKARFSYTLTVPALYPVDPLTQVHERFEYVIDSSFDGSFWACCVTGWDFAVADG